MTPPDAPDPRDPAVAARNLRTALVVLGIVAAVLVLTYVQRGTLFHHMFKVG
ncbi:MAG: hypothetical protein VKQ33_12765 [Candidatus Sericytochromatia bacterium]|nr:hypothetical protein [Candidatus Sericytochromatia bacterium]